MSKQDERDDSATDTESIKILRQAGATVWSQLLNQQDRIRELEAELTRWKKTQPQNIQDYEQVCQERDEAQAKLAVAVEAIEQIYNRSIVHPYWFAEDALQKIGVIAKPEQATNRIVKD